MVRDPTSIVARAISFAAGFTSALSARAIPLMPAYLSFTSWVSVDELRNNHATAAPCPRRRVRLGCSRFVAGFSTVFVLLGVSVTLPERPHHAWHIELVGFQITAAHVAGLDIILDTVREVVER